MCIFFFLLSSRTSALSVQGETRISAGEGEEQITICESALWPAVATLIWSSIREATIRYFSLNLTGRGLPSDLGVPTLAAFLAQGVKSPLRPRRMPPVDSTVR